MQKINRSVTFSYRSSTPDQSRSQSKSISLTPKLAQEQQKNISSSTKSLKTSQKPIRTSRFVKK